MAGAVSQIANIQLSFTQAPELAREQAPLALQAEMANAHAPAIVARYDQEASETVQQLRESQWQGVADALAGDPDREPPAKRRAPRPAHAHKSSAVAAHPRGLGSLVDVLA